jgi:hypothetical protein
MTEGPRGPINDFTPEMKRRMQERQLRISGNVYK